MAALGEFLDVEIDKYAGMVDRLLLGSSDITSYGFKSRYLYTLIYTLDSRKEAGWLTNRTFFSRLHR